MAFTSPSTPAKPNADNIMATLRRMRDDELLQYAQLHKNDPYIFPLTFQESNSRKQVRAEQAAQDTPTTQVVDKNLQEMAAPAPQMAQGMPQQGMPPQGMPPQQLPEDVGIGQLPAPNMQRMAAGGIVAFDEGGEVPGYAGGVFTGSDPFDDAFRRVMRYEGGYVANDAGKGPSKFGINKAANPDLDIAKLTEKDAKRIYRERYWDKISGDELAKKNPALATVAFDTAVNMGVTPAKRLVEQSGGDPSKILAAREQHYASLIEKDPKKFSPYQSGWQSRLADLATSLIPSAAAAELPRKTDEGLASLIPGQTAKAPPKAPAGGFLSSESFQRGATSVGLPQDVGRQAYTTLMAPTPLAPASMVPKSGPGVLGGLANLGEKLYGKIAPGKNMTEAQIAAAKAEMAAAARTGGQEQRLLTGPQAKLPGPTTPVTPAGQGITDLVAPGARMVPVAEDASRLEKMAQASNLEKLRKAQEGVGEGAAATQPAQTAARFAQEAGPASAAERIQAASIARQAEHAAQVGAAASQGQAAKTGLATLAAGSTALGNMDDGPNVITGATPVSFREFGEDTGQMPVEMPAPKEIKEIGKEATPKSERKGMSGEDFLMIGLGILSGQSPNALTNIGEGGLKGLQMVQAGRKNEAEAAYRDAMSKYYAAGTEAIERGAKDKDMVGAAEKAAHDAFTAMAKDNVFLMTNPEERAKLYNRLRMEKFAQYGISPTILGSGPSAGGQPRFLGFEKASPE